MEEYTTIQGLAKAEFVERRSRFIGHLLPVTTEEDAVAFINQCKADYWDANHNVYAYLLREGQTRRYSDDGEPQGTGGVPVLEVLQREGLVDVVCVVTRYFGGVLLGAGGLVRAYSHGAKLAVDAAQRLVMSPCTELSLEMGYDFYGKVSHLLPQFGARTLESDFGAQIALRVLLKDSRVAGFEKALAELTAARVVPRVLDSRYDCLENARGEGD